MAGTSKLARTELDELGKQTGWAEVGGARRGTDNNTFRELDKNTPRQSLIPEAKTTNPTSITENLKSG